MNASAGPATAPPRGLLAQTVHTLSFMMAGQVIAIIASVIYARLLGPGGKGILSYALTLLVFALTIADGIRAAIAYQIGTEGEPERCVFGAALK
ncbi:MAG: hypothetical protein ACREM8_08110, partial [Vulcanimicrobiaceae bacterium]